MQHIFKVFQIYSPSV